MENEGCDRPSSFHKKERSSLGNKGTISVLSLTRSVTHKSFASIHQVPKTKPAYQSIRVSVAGKKVFMYLPYQNSPSPQIPLPERWKDFDRISLSHTG